MRIVRVTEPGDLEALFRFRHRMYTEHLGWLPPRSDGLLVDPFDEDADNYSALDDHEAVIGSVRVVLDSPRGLPLEKCAPLNGYRDGRKTIAEICRLAVDPRYAGSRLGALLMKAGYERARMLGATHIALDTYVADETGTQRLYEALGFAPVTARYHDASYDCALPVQTLVLEGDSGERGLAEGRPALSRFFMTPHPDIRHDGRPVRRARALG